MKGRNCFLDFCRRRLVIGDGAMGTCLAKSGLAEKDFGGHPGCHEILCLTRPDIVLKIHRDYLTAGADLIETNSFGGAAHILAEHGLGGRCRQINRAAATLARRAADQFSTKDRPRFVAGSMGPGSKLPSLGQISYGQLASSYQPQAEGLLAGGADVIIIETCQDLLQLKAALSAVRSISGKIPVIGQVTLDATGRTLTGSDISAVLATLEPLDLQGIGLNCGLGPEGMAEAIGYLGRHSSKLLSVMPNAGLPRMRQGRAIYTLSPGDFANKMKAYAQGPGLNIAGGCCGTTPDHIRELAKTLGQAKPRKPKTQRQPAVASLFLAQELRPSIKPLIIGERTNSSGSKSFRQLLEARDYQGMVRAALEQEREGAHLIDLSLAAAGRDEVADMDRLCVLLNTALKLPVMLDCTDPKALEAGLRRLAGRAVVNSFNLEDGGRRAGRILALCREHGAAAVGMAIDQRGMATCCQRKIEVARKLVSFAAGHGLSGQDLFLDLLTFTLASGDPGLAVAGLETLKALREVKKLFPECLTVLGVSNISHGLPARARLALNSVFLHEALDHGLDAAILHAGRIQPLDSIEKKAVQVCHCLIYNKSYGDRKALDVLLEMFQKTDGSSEIRKDKKLTPDRELRRAVLSGDAAAAAKVAGVLLKKRKADRILSDILLPAMEEVGRLFKSGRMQLPFVLRSAEAMRSAAAVLGPHMGRGAGLRRGSLVLATVRGDIHDIGKDLVDMVLSANGYRVVNLGVKRTAEDIVQAVRKHRPNAIGLSGLLVESARAMGEYLESFDAAGLSLPVICGGAALNRRYVEKDLAKRYPGRVYYAADAMDGLEIMEQICRTLKAKD